MTADPHIREVGRVEDDQGHIIIIGVDHGTVTLTLPYEDTSAVALGPRQAEEFGRLYISACWQAGWYQGSEDRAAP